MSSKKVVLLPVCILTGLFISLSVFAEPKSAEMLDITSDSTEYLGEQNLMIARGNVVVKDGPNTLEANYISVDTVTMDLNAQGNVVFTSGTQVWKGDEFTYNLRTKQGDFGNFSGFYDPFYITAESSKRVSTNEIRFYNVTVTTCEGDDPAVSIRAKEGVIKGNRITMRGAVFYAANAVPFMYVPKYSRSLGTHDRFFQFLPGYSSRHGAFALTAYNYPVYENVRGISHFDLYSKRGVGLGQDFTWKDKADTYQGSLQGYYINDQDPTAGRDTEGSGDENIDSDRYRLRLAHVQDLSARDSFRGELNYLSDPYVLEDFFEAEYRNAVQPENRLTLTHRGDNYTAALQLNSRLNDFYENVNRLPELSLSVPRIELFESEIYYENNNSASYLERVYPDDSDNEGYEAFRIDSAHTIFYPTRHFGFLNLIPRAGYEATYYSKTYENNTFTNAVVITSETDGSVALDRAGNVQFTNVTDTVTREKGGAVRNVFRLGWEGSFKAFKTWDDMIIMDNGDGIRHVVEPYVDHSYTAEPNLTPDELPQFDAIDEIDKRNDMRLGVRNKLQTRRNKTPVDIIDLDLFSFYLIEKGEDDNDFTDLFINADLWPVEQLIIEMDGRYDMYESDINAFDTRIGYRMRDDGFVKLEHLYRKEEQSLLGVKLDLFPQDKWSVEAGFRYEAEDGDLEEQYCFIKNRRPCLSWGAGYRQVDVDVQVWLQLWLTAFPDSQYGMRY